MIWALRAIVAALTATSGFEPFVDAVPIKLQANMHTASSPRAYLPYTHNKKREEQNVEENDSKRTDAYTSGGSTRIGNYLQTPSNKISLLSTQETVRSRTQNSALSGSKIDSFAGTTMGQGERIEANAGHGAKVDAEAEAQANVQSRSKDRVQTEAAHGAAPTLLDYMNNGGDGNPGTTGGCSGNCSYPAYNLNNQMLIGTHVPHGTGEVSDDAGYMQPKYIGPPILSGVDMPWTNVMQMAADAVGGVQKLKEGDKGSDLESMSSVLASVDSSLGDAKAGSSSASATSGAVSGGNDGGSGGDYV